MVSLVHSGEYSILEVAELVGVGRSTVSPPSNGNASKREPAVAAYLREGATALGYGIMVLTIEKDKIGEITGFADPTLFPLFGLAARIDW